MRFIAFGFLFVLISCSVVYAQTDSAGVKNSGNTTLLQPGGLPFPDSTEMAKQKQEQFRADSIAMFYLVPDSMRENQSIINVKKDKLSSIYLSPAIGQKPDVGLYKGHIRGGRSQWIIAVIIGLLIYTAFLNLFLGKDIKSVIQSFYNKHALSPTDKEGGLINSWAFIGLFILFSLTFALFLCLLTAYNHVNYNVKGVELFITLSVIIGLLFALKFLVLKFLGFIFDVNNLVSQYIAILNLTYFNIAFVLLAVVICFSLLSGVFIPYLLAFTLASVVIIFAWQYLRNSVNIISSIRFHKFYLFIYLCALEICPILILIKAFSI